MTRPLPLPQADLTRAAHHLPFRFAVVQGATLALERSIGPGGIIFTGWRRRQFPPKVPQTFRPSFCSSNIAKSRVRTQKFPKRFIVPNCGYLCDIPCFRPVFCLQVASVKRNYNQLWTTTKKRIFLFRVQEVVSSNLTAPTIFETSDFESKNLKTLLQPRRRSNQRAVFLP